MKPVVDRLEKEYSGKVEFRKYWDDFGAEGNALYAAIGGQYVPTFLFVSRDGTIAKQQVGGMSEEQLRAALDSLK